jgi:hypothetical protein
MGTITRFLDLLENIGRDVITFGLDHPAPIGGILLAAVVAMVLAWRSGNL